MAGSIRPGATAIGADAAGSQRLRRWVVAIGLLVVLANVATDAFDQWRAYTFAVADAARELENTARILAAQTEGTLKTVDVLLHDIAASYPRIAAMMRDGDTDAQLAGRVEG